jgi:hypothetical protein
MRNAQDLAPKEVGRLCLLNSECTEGGLRGGTDQQSLGLPLLL